MSIANPIVSDALRTAIDLIEADLALPQLLAVAGAPHRAGTSDADGLRLDWHVGVTALSLDRVLAIAERLALHPRVQEFAVRDESGAWNLDEDRADSLRLRAAYRDAEAREWTVTAVFAGA